MDRALVRGVELIAVDGDEPRAGYPWDLPAVRALSIGLALHPKVTYLVGENGSGKSTVLEAIAVAAGMNPEGGSSNFAFSTRDSHSPLSTAIRLIRGARQRRSDFFLRAESMFTAASYLDELDREDPRALSAYGGRSLHEQSHGEAFLAVMLNRMGADGFYVMDEPEAALSTQNCLTCLRRIHELVSAGSQFVIASHSPIILAYPDAALYVCDERGLTATAYENAEPVRLMQSFLTSRSRFLDELFAD
jgi:predicted ATPase